MTDGHLTTGVYGDGLIARIGAEGMDAAMAGPGVRAFDMTGRPMRGIIVVAGEAARGATELLALGLGLGYRRASRCSGPCAYAPPLEPRPEAAALTPAR